MPGKLISVVIPCYRSEKSINVVLDEIEQVVSTRKGYDVEIICVNDHSPDNVWHVLIERVKWDSKVIAIDLARNFGQHSALMAGYHMAQGDYIFSLDDDGEAPVDAIYQAIDKMEEGNYDVVIGEYDHKISANVFRKFGSFCNEWMSRLLADKPTNLYMSTFRCMRPFIKKEICRYQGCYPYTSGLIFRATKNCVNIPVHHRRRIEGNSGYTIGKLLTLWLNGFTAFSVKPLRLASILGVCASILGFLHAVYCIIHKIVNPNMQMGYASLMSIMLILGGIIMLMLGLIGEYIGRIYICLNNSPQYVIRQVIGHSIIDSKKQ